MTTDSSTILHTATGTQDTDQVLDTLIGSGSSGKGAFYAALQQIIENAVDAGAQHIDVLVKKSLGVIRITDDGRGFTGADINGFHSLYVSPKRGKEGLIGKNGSGRIFMLLLGKRIEVFSMSAEFPGMITFTLQRSDLKDLLLKSKIERDVVGTSKPDWWDLEGTGSAVCIREIKWEMIPTPGEIVAKFATYLKPSIAQIVHVNGNPLKPREVVGDVIHEIIKVDYLSGGLQEFELFIPTRRPRQHQLKLGGHNPIMSLRDFANQLPAEIGQLIPTVLLSGAIVGDIFIPELNAFAAHDRNSFKPELFQDSLLMRVIRFLQEEIEPRVEAAFRRKETDEKQEEDEAFLLTLKESVNRAWPVDWDAVGTGENETPDPNAPGPKPRPPAPDISVNSKRIALLPGQQYLFKVLNQKGSFTWDAAASGGTIDAKLGPEVLYTAGMKLGRYSLAVSNARSTTSVQIRIIGERPLMISPTEVEFPAGTSHPFRVKNPENVAGSGEIVWEINPSNPNVTLTSARGLTTTLVTKRSASGTYELVAYDKRDPDYNRAVSVVTVTEADDLNDAKIICIEGTYYELEASSMYLPNVVELKPGENLDLRSNTGEAIDVLSIDLNHPLLKSVAKLSTSPEAVRQAILPHIATAHLEGLISKNREEFDESSFRGRCAEIVAKINEALASPPKNQD